jgi:hypothetical protein
MGASTEPRRWQDAGGFLSLTRLVVLLALAGVVSGTADSSPPTVSFVATQAAPGDLVSVRVAGLRPGRARLALVPGGVAVDPIFRVSRRGTARFRATVPNALPGEYKLAVVRNRRTLARSSRALRIVDPPPGIRGCQNSQYGDLGPDWEQGSLRAGPIAFAGMARGVPPDYVARSRNVIKVIVVVDKGAVATLRVVRADRQGVALAYVRRPGHEARRVADGLPAMKFHACHPSDWRPHTQFGGTFIVDRSRCAHLEVYVEGRAEPIPVAIPFGAPC